MDALIDQCTSEKLNHDKWDLILRICEEYGVKEPKACLKSICRRIFHKNSNISLRAITLLDACSKNCGKPFNREVASRDFTQTVKGRFTTLAEIPSVKLTEVFEKWAEEFKSDSELALAASLYTWVKSEHEDVVRRLNNDRQVAKSSSATRTNISQLQAKEDEELAKAIALSLKESDVKRSTDGASRTGPQQQNGGTSSNTGVCKSDARTNLNSTGTLNAASSKGHVRALYDFEAAEDNELTFKAGELIVLIDDSDENWWRGSNHRGEGLFPAQFVRCEQQIDETVQKPSTSRPAVVESQSQVVLDAGKLDECLRLINSVDPTGEFRPDPIELSRLEAECNAMAPLVDPELEKVDKCVLMLSELNQRLLDAFQMYHDLMSQAPVPMITPYYSFGGMPISAGAAYVGPPATTSGLGNYGPLTYGSSSVATNPQLAPAAAYGMPEATYPGHPSMVYYPTSGYQPQDQVQPDDTTQAPNLSTSSQQPYAVSDVYAGTYRMTQPPVPTARSADQADSNLQPHHTVPKPHAFLPPGSDPHSLTSQQQASYYHAYGQINPVPNRPHTDGTMAPPNHSFG